MDVFGSVYSSSSASSVDVGTLMLCVVASLAIGAALAAMYCVRSRHTASFVATLAVVPAIVCVVIALVNGNVGAGVAVMGAFSLVRFRSAPGSARDIGFLFLAMAVGLACGMGYVAVGAAVAAVIGGAYTLIQLSGVAGRSGAAYKTLRVTVPEDLDFAGMFDEVLSRYATEHELVDVRTAGMGSVYKLTYDVALRGGASEKGLIDEVRCLNGNLEVSLSHRKQGTEEL